LVAANKAAANSADLDGTRALHWAIRAGEAGIVDVLLKAGADARAKDRLGVTPLFLAAMNGDGAILRMLLNAGANANQVEETGESILMVAIRTGSTDAVRALLEHKASANYAEPQLQLTPLMLAAAGGNAEIVADLIKSGADVQVRTRTGPVPERRLPCVRPSGCGSHGVGIVRGGWPEKGIRAPITGNMSPLMYAAREGRIDAARLLLDAGAHVNEVDQNDISPLLLAISNNHPDMAQFLIAKGANINVKDWYGRTPLFAAVEMRNADMHYVTFALLHTAESRKANLDLIKMLLEKGADPNIQLTEVPPLRPWMYLGGGSLAWVDFTGQTPFLLASLSGDVSTMRLLLEYKADPKIATFGGTTALMAASGINWVFSQTYSEGEPALLEAVKLCVELGMDVNEKNSMGLTPVMGAANRGSDSIIEYLVSKGAKLDAKDNVGRTPYNWAEGVFLATLSPIPKPTSMTLIEKLSAR
jgi:ankyrin repeat protein